MASPYGLHYPEMEEFVCDVALWSSFIYSMAKNCLENKINYRHDILQWMKKLGCLPVHTHDT
jgi:hypothetical protein